MNLLHFKYAVEIAKTKSISQAAENLYMGQPNLSRAIKELEEKLGITIFLRNSKGIAITDEGEEFLQYAKKIVSQVEEVEQRYQEGIKKQHFSVCVPRASYVSYALSEFAGHINPDAPVDITYRETNSMRTLQTLIKEECNLGIVRYQVAFDKYFKNMFEEKKLVSELVTEFSYVLLISKEHPLAGKEEILAEDLESFIEITHADPYVPSVPMTDVKKAEFSKNIDKRIYVYERASQFALLEKVPTTFMWVSPIPQELCDKYGLVQKVCKFNNKVYKDVMVYRKGYKLTELDKRFIENVCDAKRKYTK